MSNPEDNDELLAIAASISNGSPVDWDQLREQFANTDHAAIVDELQLLHGVASAISESAAWGSLQILDEIGRGAFATVYRAFDADLQREVALKITRLDPATRSAPQQTVAEARLLARVRHPNVVSVFGAQRKENNIALAMELIKGQTLDDVVRRQGPFSAREATLIGLDLCRAVAAVHEAGLIHGDIKAHNAMREEGGRIVLMDFGTGKDLKAPLHVTGDFAGTPLYLAPEIFAGQARTKTSDIYSLGVLLYYLSTGSYPVEGTTRTEVDRHHLEPTARRRLRDARPDLPEAFVRVIERATAETPDDRYQTAGAFEAALLDSLDQHIESNHRGRFRRPGAIAAAALITLSTAGIITYYILQNGRGTVADTSGTGTRGTPSVAAAAAGATPSESTYRVEAAMYRVRDRVPQRLQRHERLAPGDELYLEIQASIPTYVYVVNEDAQGNSVRLFPIRGEPQPLRAAARHRVPDAHHWQVSSPGVREHFVIFVSPTRLTHVEELLASLPSPEEDTPVTYGKPPDDTTRGVGGLVKALAPKTTAPLFSAQYTTPLPDGPENARGPWIRQVAFDNPVR